VCNDRAAEGVPRVYYHGVHQQHAALVMELLGPSLEDLFARCQRHFTVKTIAMIAIQLVSCAHTVHGRVGSSTHRHAGSVTVDGYSVRYSVLYYTSYFVTKVYMPTY